MAKTIKDLMNSMIICDTDGMMYIDLKKCPDLIEFSRIENLIKKRIKELEENIIKHTKHVEKYHPNLKYSNWIRLKRETIEELRRLLGE